MEFHDFPGLFLSADFFRILNPFLESLCYKSYKRRHKNNVTVQYLHSYESKSIENRLRRWDFDLYVSGFWHL